MRQAQVFSMVLCAGLLVGAPGLWAGKSGSAPSADCIEVIAHFPLSGAAVTQLTAGTHWQKDYLYLDHGALAPVTILDVTNPVAPVTAGQFDVPAQEANGRLSTVVGSAVLIAQSSSPVVQPAIPQTISVLSFADPEDPSVARQFPGVTAMLKDPGQRLVYLVNSDGLWVLRLEPATDMAAQKAYEDYVLYEH